MWEVLEKGSNSVFAQATVILLGTHKTELACDEVSVAVSPQLEPSLLSVSRLPANVDFKREE